MSRPTTRKEILDLIDKWKLDLTGYHLPWQRKTTLLYSPDYVMGAHASLSALQRRLKKGKK